MHARVLIAIYVLLATANATDGTHGKLFHRWLTRGPLPAPCQHAAAANRDEALPASALETAWSKVANDIRNSVMYFVETKQELFLFGEAPAVPAPLTIATNTDTGAVSASTRTPATRPSASATSTSTFGTSTSAPASSTSVSATITTAPTAGTSAPNTSSNALLSSSTIPPGYTYSSATGSYYKFQDKYMTWYVANTTCAREGAHVVVVNDAEEADVVARIVRDAGQYPTWTGLRDNRPGGVMDWRTVHGEPLSDVYNAWADGASLNDTGRTCAGFSAYNMGLYDWSCGGATYFTCEISQ